MGLIKRLGPWRFPWYQGFGLSFLAGLIVSEVFADSETQPLWGLNPAGVWRWSAVALVAIALLLVGYDRHTSAKLQKAARYGACFVLFALGCLTFGWFLMPTYTNGIGSPPIIALLAVGYAFFAVVMVFAFAWTARGLALVAGIVMGVWPPGRATKTSVSPPRYAAYWTLSMLAGFLAGAAILVIGFWTGSPPAGQISFDLSRGETAGFVYPMLRLTGVLWTFLGVLVAVGVWRSPGGSMWSEMRQLLGPQGEAFRALIEVSQQQSRGVPVDEWDAAALEAMVGLDDPRAWNLLYSWSHIHGKTGLAGEYLDRMLAADLAEWKDFAAYFEAFHRRNLDRALSWSRPPARRCRRRSACAPAPRRRSSSCKATLTARAWMPSGHWLRSPRRGRKRRRASASPRKG